MALNDLGIARDLQGRHADAQTAYRQALGINPEMSAAQVNLALSLAMSGQSHDAVQLLRPLADRPGATQQTRHDLAAVLTMNGDRTAAAEILSKDLPPAQVQEALNAFASAQPNAAAAMMGAAPTPAPERSAMAPTAGSVMVQLAGPVPSRDAAQAKWDRLAKEMPNELGGRAPIIAEVEEHGHSVWRVRTSGFADGAAANTFCDRVRITGTSYIVIQ